MTSVLVVDDSPEEREFVADQLQSMQGDISVTGCGEGSDALLAVEKEIFDCVLLDLRLEGEDGLDVLAALKVARPSLPVVVLTGQGSERTAVEAFVAGAAYYLPKQGLDAEALWVAVTRVIEQAKTELELIAKREAMERSNRLDAVGQLAAGIAHDFNNHLGTLCMSLELLKKSELSERSRSLVDTALMVVDESSTLASRLLSFSRQGDLLAVNVPLSSLFEDIYALTMAATPEDIVLEFGDVGKGMAAFCDPGQLINAVLNLILNSIDAIASKGSDGRIQVTVEAIAGVDAKIGISVTDNGKGMSEQVLAKCTDPFFTTKFDRNGTGLGLAMVQSFVEDNDGDLILRSSPEGGTKATIVLPASVAKPHQRRSSVEDTLVLQQKLRVLLVEDHAMFASMMQQLLTEHGCTVFNASSAAEGLSVFSAQLDIDLLVADIRMRDKTGFELASEIRAQRPDLPVIFMTGYADNPILKTHDMHGPILRKPIEPSLMISTINEVLMAGHE